MVEQPYNTPRRIKQVQYFIVRGTARPLAIRYVDQKGLTTSRSASLDIAPAIADHKAVWKTNVIRTCGLKQHTGPRFAAVAAIRIVMVACEDGLQRQLVYEPLIDPLDGRARLRAARHIGLIRDDDQHQVVLCEQRYGLHDAGQ